MNNTDLIRIHHANYKEDIPFWLSCTKNYQPILEIGCGHGRVLRPLLEAGREVVGVDIDLAALKALKKELDGKAPELHKRAQILHEDIAHFQTGIKFGSVIIPCNTYSTFSLEERNRIISKAYDLITSGGVFVASMPNPVQVQALFKELSESKEHNEVDLETTFPHPETGFPVQVSSSLYARDKSLGWDWIYDHLFPDGQVERFIQSTEHYPTSFETYHQELTKAGFAEISSKGDFDSSEYSDDSPYLILIAEKPGN